MDILKKLSPAEIKVILEPNKVKVTELLKLTFLDLLMKQVIKLDLVEETVRTSKQVSRAAKYENYVPAKHEELFTDAFKEAHDLVLTVYETMRMVKSEITSSRDFKWAYLIEPRLTEYFKSRPRPTFLEVFTRLRLNETGKSLQGELESFFNGFEKKVQDKSLTIDEAKSLYNTIGSNFILIEGFDSSFMKEMFEEVREEKKNIERTSDYIPIDGTTISSNDGKEERSFDIPAIPILGGVIVFEMLEHIESIAESVSDSFSSSFDSFDNSNPFSGDGDGGFFSGDGSGSGDFGGDSGCSGCGGGD